MIHVCLPRALLTRAVNFQKSCREGYHKRVFSKGVLAAGQIVFLPVLFLSILILVVHNETLFFLFLGIFLSKFSMFFPLAPFYLLFIDGDGSGIGTTSPGKTKGRKMDMRYSVFLQLLLFHGWGCFHEVWIWGNKKQENKNSSRYLD